MRLSSSIYIYERATMTVIEITLQSMGTYTDYALRFNSVIRFSIYDVITCSAWRAAYLSLSLLLPLPFLLPLSLSL